MQNFWDRLKVGIREGASVSAERIETYSKIGRLKMDQLNQKNLIKKNEHKLGVLLYHLVKNNAASTVEGNTEVHEIISIIDNALVSIDEISEKIAQIKTEKEEDFEEMEETPLDKDAQEDID